MSVLQLVKSSTTDRCFGSGCHRVGKHAVLIAGHPVLSDRVSFSPRALLCGPCRTEWRRAWDEASGAAALEEVRAAIGDLLGSESERAHAIFALRDLGCTNEDIAHVLAGVGDRLSTEQILEGLVDGVGEREAVAA